MDFLQEKVEFQICEDALWMPVYTRPLHEFRLYDYLRKQEIPVYLPVVPALKIHNVVKGGKSYSYRKEVLRPMLKSYLFARLSSEQKRAVWDTRFVNNILQVPPEQQSGFISELRNLQLVEVLSRNSKVEFKKELQVNDRFVIESPREFLGVEGYLVEKRKMFLWVVKLAFLGQYLDVEIDPATFKMRRI